MPPKFKFTREQINYLKEIKEQVLILYESLCTIHGFNFGTLKNVDAVVTRLTNSKVDLSYLSHLNSPHTQECIMQINNALDARFTTSLFTYKELRKMS